MLTLQQAFTIVLAIGLVGTASPRAGFILVGLIGAYMLGRITG